LDFVNFDGFRGFRFLDPPQTAALFCLWPDDPSFFSQTARNHKAILPDNGSIITYNTCKHPKFVLIVNNCCTNYIRLDNQKL